MDFKNYLQPSESVFTTLHFLRNMRMAQAARVFDHSRQERLARDKRSSLLGSFISYKENKVLTIRPLVVKVLIFI
jgi:hypothetical protein